MCEEIGRLERAANGLRTLADPCFGLLDPIERQEPERDRDTRLEGGELEAARCLAGDVVEVRRVAANDTAERHDAGEAPGLRERGRGQRKLERAGNDHDGDRLLSHARGRELGQRAVEKLGRDTTTEPRQRCRQHDTTFSYSFEHRVAIRE